jgi:hypothetical protein
MAFAATVVVVAATVDDARELGQHATIVRQDSAYGRAMIFYSLYHRVVRAYMTYSGANRPHVQPSHIVCHTHVALAKTRACCMFVDRARSSLLCCAVGKQLDQVLEYWEVEMGPNRSAFMTPYHDNCVRDGTEGQKESLCGLGRPLHACSYCPCRTMAGAAPAPIVLVVDERYLLMAQERIWAAQEDGLSGTFL